jgi:membrane-associated phospholipid phosphatase
MVQPPHWAIGQPAAWDRQGFELFLSFMDRSMFEGEAFGAGDIPILIQIGALVLYSLSFFSRAPGSLRRLRPGLAYVWVSALATAALVHLFKGIVARPRPYEVAQGVSAFHFWYDLRMPKLFAFAKGSFPSGHTAGAATLWSLVTFAGWLYPNRRIAVSALAFLSIVFCFVMGFSRVAHGDHWPTDTMAAILCSFFVASMLGNLMLKSSVQDASFLKPSKEVLFDLAILFWSCAVWLTVGAFYLGLKLFAHGDLFWGIAALIAFVGGIYGTSLARVRSLRS